jgi:uncharacterized protein YktA (UPF0223 family)
VDILLSYHFGEEIFRRNDPRNIVMEHFNSIRLPYEYTIDFWEKDEVHKNYKTYEEVISNKCAHPKGMIIDQEAIREVAIKEEE